MANKLGYFIAGGLIGAAAVFFTSPRSGFENRNLAKSAVGAIASELPNCSISGTDDIQTVAKNVAASAQEFAEVAAEKGQEFYVTATAKASEVLAGARGTSAEDDELREKIEAARQRIAAQVIKNAEESQAAVEQIAIQAEAEQA